MIYSGLTRSTINKIDGKDGHQRLVKETRLKRGCKYKSPKYSIQ